MLPSRLQVSWLYQGKPPSVPKSCLSWKVWKDSSLEGVVVFSVTPPCSQSLWWMVSQAVPWWMVPCSYLQEGWSNPCRHLQVRRPCWPFLLFRAPAVSFQVKEQGEEAAFVLPLPPLALGPILKALHLGEREQLARGLAIQGWWDKNQGGRRSPNG